MYQLAIFDMDGTILDTLDDLRDSLNHTLEKWNYPPRTLQQVRQAVGNGIRNLIIRSLPEGTPPQTVDGIFADFMPYYNLHCADKTRPYDGINRTILALRQRGVVCAVLSNKADGAVQALAQEYFPGCFDLAVGERPGVPRKPAPDGVNSILAQLGYSRAQSVYIGDSEVDYATAQNAGLDAIMVTWGFRDRATIEVLGADLFADSPEELVELIAGSCTL